MRMNYPHVVAAVTHVRRTLSSLTQYYAAASAPGRGQDFRAKMRTRYRPD